MRYGDGNPIPEALWTPENAKEFCYHHRRFQETPCPVFRSGHLDLFSLFAFRLSGSNVRQPISFSATVTSSPWTASAASCPLWPCVTVKSKPSGRTRRSLPARDQTTKKIDLKGRTVLPGFIDVHTHALAWAEGMVPDEVDATYPKVHTIAEIKSAVAQHAKTRGRGQWVRGGGWDDAKLARAPLSEQG